MFFLYFFLSHTKSNLNKEENTSVVLNAPEKESEQRTCQTLTGCEIIQSVHALIRTGIGNNVAPTQP
jgi:hypothetical protein